MKTSRRLLGAALAALMALSAAAEVPATMQGRWRSDAITSHDGEMMTVAVYDFTFAPQGDDMDFKATLDITGMQLGSKTMKVNLPLTIQGPAKWVLMGDKLVITFPQEPAVEIDPAKVVLDIPASMKSAMAARMDEFMSGITGGIHDAYIKSIRENGVVFDDVDVNPANPTVLHAAEDKVPLEMNRLQ